LDLAGNDLTNYLKKLLIEDGLANGTTAEKTVRDLKETSCYVALDYQQELSKPVAHKLPDGKEITIGNESFRCPEALFQPTLVRKQSARIQTLAYNSIMKCAPNIKKKLYSNIVLAGGVHFSPILQKGWIRK